MNRYSLAPMVGWAPVADRSVFLDLRADRYVEAKGALHRAMTALLEGAALTSTDHKALEPLVHQGLLNPRAPGSLSLLNPPPKSQLDTADARPAAALPFGLWRDIAHIRRRLRQGGLADLIGQFGSPEPIPAGLSEDLGRCVTEFLGQRRWVPVPPKCLWDSIALVRYLGKYGVRPTLVFGVKLDPFAAHCWVQADGLLLTDSPDRVGAFTPLLAV